VKLWARVRCLDFLTHSVYLGKHWNAKMQKSRLSNAVIMVRRSAGTCCLIFSILLTCISYAWCRHKSCTVIMRVRLWLLRHNCRRNELLQQNCAAWWPYHGWRRGVVVSGVRRWTKLTHVGPGYYWDGWLSSGGYTISGCNQPTRSTQLCIPPGSLNRVPASAGVRAGMSLLPGGR